MIKKLKKKFISIAMIAVTAVLLLLVLSVNTANCLSVWSEVRGTLKSISDNRGKIPRPDENIDKNIEDIFAGRAEKPYFTRYFVLGYDDDGNVAFADLENIAAVTEDDIGEFVQKALKNGEGYGRYGGYAFLVTVNGENKNSAVFIDCYRQMGTLANFAILSFFAMVVCVGLVFFILHLCARKIIDPIIKATEKQKQFITDAGHELKTPLTVIATSLKVLEMENGKHKWIDKALAQTEKLKELVNAMTSLSKMDEGASTVNMRDFDFSSAVWETVDSFVDFALEKGHKLVYDICKDTVYKGDEYAVRQLCSVLLDNAVKYASDGSDIQFKAEKLRHGVAIICGNRCEEFAEGETEKIFHRFYRRDKSRSSDGFGIGLSLAQTIAESHNGSIRATEKNGYIEFYAELK